MRIRFWPIAISVLACGAIGPRLTAPHDKSAGAPFAYEPPEGFVPSKDTKDLLEDTSAKTWVLASPEGAFVPRVSLAHGAGTGTVEEDDLARIVEGLPDTFEKDGVTWTHRRHETRTRPDGARVGLIEGDCVEKRDAGLLLGLPARLRFRRLQLAFPDDTGTSIVTAQFPSDEAPKWEPVFEASIARAKGVATRVPPPPAWMVLAWAGAGLLLGALVSAMLASRAAARPA